MIRAQFKDDEYFDKKIKFRTECITEDIEELNLDPTFTTKIKMRYAIGLVTDYLILLELKYSRGDAIETMVEDVKAVLFYRKLQKHFADNLPPKEQSARNQWEHMTSERARDIYQWLTFALAVGMDKVYFSEALTLIQLSGEDLLFDSIAVKLGYHQKINPKLFDPDTFSKLMAVLESPPEKQAKAMNKYIDFWYKDSEINDMHIETIDGYTGYWCYEAALVTMLWKLDDSGWRDHPYYPRDLVKL